MKRIGDACERFLDDVIAALDEEEMAKVNTEGESRQFGEEGGGANRQFLKDDEACERHQKDVDVAERPHDFKFHWFVRNQLLGEDESTCRNCVANQEKRNGSTKRFTPGPIEGIGLQVIGKDDVAEETGEIIKCAEGVP